MPGNDGTGPLGTGPLGWGRGPCGAGMARGFERGLGRGSGWRAWDTDFPQPNKEEQKRVLEAHLKYALDAKKDIEKRLAELGTEE